MQRIAQPSPTELTVTVYRAGTSYTLLLSCHPVWARMCLTTMRVRALPEPTPFTMVCRKHLHGARITEITQIGFDRIAQITLHTPTGNYRLIGEFMGRYSNIVLVNANNVILDAARRVPASVNRYRTLAPGVLYVPPPPLPDAADPFHPEFSRTLQKLLAPSAATSADLPSASVAGLSPFLVRELVLRSREKGMEAAWREVFGPAISEAWMPVLILNDAGQPSGAYPIPTVQIPAERRHPRPTYCQALEEYASAALRQDELERIRAHLMAEIAEALRAVRKRIQDLNEALSHEALADEMERNANLILAYPHAAPDASGTVTVPNLYEEGSPPKHISVDPALTLVENAQALFHQSRKLRNAARVARDQMPSVEEREALLLRAQSAVASASTLNEVQRLEADLHSAGLLRRPPTPAIAGQKSKPITGHPHIRAVTTPEGWHILYGENAEANDALLRQVAAPDDLWFHARAVASAHAIIRTGGRPQSVPPEVIRRAAELVARKSAAKHSAIVPVDYTLRKFVRKPKGSPPGAVVYERESTLHVSPAKPEALDG